MRGLILTLFFFSWGIAQSEVLDKIVAVFGNEIITLSQLKRTRATLQARKKISPLIFSESKYSLKQLAHLRVKQLLIREKLSQIGYIVSDEQVEGQIKNIERNSGFTRQELLEFLKENRLTFDEYFEIIRESIEHNIFISRVISPLVSVTEQDIKNTFYKQNLKNKTLAFKYKLTDFSLEKRFMKKGMIKRFKKVLESFQKNGVLPQEFSKIQTTVLGEVTEENLTKKLKKLLKRTDEGAFTEPILLGDDYHVFFVQKKDLVESEIFTKSKRRIKHSLALKLEAQVLADWIKQEQSKHHIKYFFQ